MSLSQIGEFSFIIATLGLTLQVTSEFLYPVAVAVSVLTTFTTPYMIKFSPHVYEKARSLLPGRWLERMNRYSVGAQNVAEEGDWKKLLRFYALNVMLFSVVIIFIILLSTSYMLPLFSSFRGGTEITAVVSLLVLAPFLWALAFRRMQPQAYAKVWASSLQRGPLIILMISRLALALFFIGLLFRRLYTPAIAFIGVITTAFLLSLFYNKIKRFYGKIELRFLNNYNSREEPGVSKDLAPWDTHMSVFEMSAQSPYIGKTLQESKIREDFGVNIAIIERGNQTINVPARDQRLYPYDRLSVIGTDEQLKNFRVFLDISKSEGEILAPRQSVTLQHFTIAADSALAGKSIRHSGIRERTNGLIVGIERNGEHILNPESDLVFEPQDVVWVVGNEKRIAILSKAREKK
jgi:CPA2 family monovalent cation:H+ antiporter-2